jgi:hypothetical protein
MLNLTAVRPNGVQQIAEMQSQATDGSGSRTTLVGHIEAQSIPHILADHPLWWAIERFMLVVGTDVSPEDCWKAILEVLARDPPKNVIGVLAAGALEDLIASHGAEFIERIESESRRNPAFRHLLGGV